LASEAGRAIRIGAYQAHPIKCKIWFRVAPMMLMNETFFSETETLSWTKSGSVAEMGLLPH